MNYFSSGRYNQKLKEAHAYNKKRKELLENGQKENNTQERCGQKKEGKG